MGPVESSPAQGVTLCHLERVDDQGKEEERKGRESQEQEACPFSLMDSCHRRIEGNGGRRRTWGAKER